MAQRKLELEENEVIKYAYSGNHKIPSQMKDTGDSGTWTLTNKRLNFRLMIFGQYENNIYYEDIVSMRKSHRPGFYELNLVPNSRSAQVADTVFFGVTPWKMKEAIGYIVEQIGEDKVEAPSKFSLYFFIGMVVCVAALVLYMVLTGA